MEGDGSQGMAALGWDLDLARTLDGVPQAIVVTDAAGRIALWNRGAEALYGWTAADALGRHVLELAAEQPPHANGSVVMDALRAGQAWTGEVTLRRRDGSTFLALVTDTPILDVAGRVVGVVGISEDVTEASGAARALGQSRQRLGLALDAGGLGVWEWDQRSDVLSWDRNLERIYGLPEGAHPTSFEGYAALLHPEDRDRAVATIGATEPGTTFNVEHRVVRPDGTVRWVSGSGQVIVDGGEVVGMVGVAADITDRREAEAERQRLLEEERAARALADAASARLSFLAEVTGQLLAIDEADERLRRLARLAVPRLADGCATYLLAPTGEIDLVGLHHRDAGCEMALRSLLERYPARIDAPAGTGAAIRSARPSWLPTITDDLLRAVAVDEDQLALLRGLDLTAGVAVPLFGRDEPIGAISLFTTGGRGLVEEDAALAEELASRTGLLVENARLYEARQRQERDARYQAALLGAMYDSSIDGVLVVDPAGAVLSHNRRFLELWGVEPEQLAGGPHAVREAARTRVADPAAFEAGVREIFRSRPATAHGEVLLADGRRLERDAVALVVDGEHLGFAWHFRDVTESRRQQDAIVAAGERSALLARTLQQSLLPPRLPTLPGVDLAARYHPALDGLEVGGDFYDVFSVGEEWVLVLGDVCGKGAEAAALTGLIRYTIRAVAIHDPDPAAILTELNRVMVHDAAGGADHDDGDTRFATVCCVRLRPGPGSAELQVACGGHPPPLVVRAGGAVEDASRPGTLIGAFDDVELTTSTTTLHPGDCLVACTDGVLEARDAHGRTLDRGQLATILAGLAGAGAGTIAAALARDAVDWQGGVPHDDIAVLVAAIPPTG